MDSRPEQPEGLRIFLLNQQQKDSYNKFCIDCNKNESTHASVTFGVLICEQCAMTHSQELGMEQSYVKSLTGELWDEYQCKCLLAGGNKKFWDFLKLYDMEWKPINYKYTSKVAKYYRRKLAALAQNREFKEEPPARNIEEVFGKGVSSAKDFGVKAEESVKKFGSFLGEKISQSGVSQKISGLFRGNQSASEDR